MLISAITCLRENGKEWRNVSLYGQEINALTSAIARMNLFLHGIEDFHIVNDDTQSTRRMMILQKRYQFARLRKTDSHSAFHCMSKIRLRQRLLLK